MLAYERSTRKSTRDYVQLATQGVFRVVLVYTVEGGATRMRRSLRILTVHSAAKSFNADLAPLYSEARPGYSSEAVDRILNVSRLKQISGPNVLEIGAGTGKLTSSFLQKWSGSMKFLATEPSEGFRDELKKSLALQGLPPKGVELSIRDGTGQSTPALEGQDLVLFGQCYHWCSGDDTLKEAHRVLKGKAPIVLVWNVLDMDEPWIHDIEREIIDKYYIVDKDNAMIPRYLSQEWRKSFDTPTAQALFTPPETWYGGYQRSQVTTQQILNRVASISVISRLDAEEKGRVEKNVKKILTRYFPTATPASLFPLIYKTDVTHAYRID